MKVKRSHGVSDHSLHLTPANNIEALSLFRIVNTAILCTHLISIFRSTLDNVGGSASELSSSSTSPSISPSLLQGKRRGSNNQLNKALFARQRRRLRLSWDAASPASYSLPSTSYMYHLNLQGERGGSHDQLDKAPLAWQRRRLRLSWDAATQASLAAQVKNSRDPT